MKMPNFRSIPTMLLALTAGGCAAINPFPEEERNPSVIGEKLGKDKLAKLAGGVRIHALHHDAPPLLVDPPRLPTYTASPGFASSPVYTGGGAAQSLLGSLLDELWMHSQAQRQQEYPELRRKAEERGREYLKAHSISDPISIVKLRTLSELRQNGLRDIHDMPQPLGGTADFDQLRTRFGQGFALEFATRSWETHGLTPMMVSYSAVVRLLNLEESTVVWEEKCSFSQNVDHPPSAGAQSNERNGQALRRKLAQLAEECASGFLSGLLPKDTGKP